MKTYRRSANKIKQQSTKVSRKVDEKLYDVLDEMAIKWAVRAERLQKRYHRHAQKVF